MDGPGFLFVTENPTVSGKKRHSLQINRHAQLTTNAKKRPKLPLSTAPRGWSEFRPASGDDQGTVPVSRPFLSDDHPVVRLHSDLGGRALVKVHLDDDVKSGHERFLPGFAGLLTVLREGQSDPFHAFAIPIDCKVNLLMTYCREFELPSITGGANNMTRRVNPEDWSQCVAQLTDSCSAYAHLTRAASAMSSDPSQGTTGTARQALVFRGKAVALLRKKLANVEALRNDLVFGSVMSMLLVELYTCNLDAALSHSKMIAHMLQNEGLVVGARRTL